jgi:hypothetical protein
MIEKIINTVVAKNQTTVGTGTAAGGAATIIWWIVGATTGLTVPVEVVAGSVAVMTAVIQWFVQPKSGQ